MADGGDKLKAAGSVDEYRMTLGEHLEELRKRMVLGLGGFAVVLVVCLIYGREVTAYFCLPLITVLQDRGLNPQVFSNQLADGFMVFIRISMISAAVIASPWMVYQLWQFVAAGLYPAERRWVTRYAPLSVGLMVTGFAFVYFLVLPWTIEFFVDWTGGIPLPGGHSPVVEVLPTTLPSIPAMAGDPAAAADGAIWVNTVEGRLKMMLAGQARVVPFGPQELVAPMFNLPDYVALVVSMLALFGLSFQLPLVVMGMVAIGIVDLATVRNMRRQAYLILVVVAAVITPGDVITASLALTLPLIGLYEFGILLSAWNRTGRTAVPSDLA
jgi:sec-independent protein translocase protein TatC